MSEIKSCPFCGENKRIAIENDQENCIFVRCNKCNAQADWFNFGEEKKAIQSWNKRAECNCKMHYKAEIKMLRSLGNEVVELRKKVAELEEYKFKYDGLSK